MSTETPSTKEILLGQITENLGEHALDTVTPTDVTKPSKAVTDTDDDFVPSCVTQNPVPKALRNGSAAIMVGLNKECPRWAPGSVIKWVAWTQGFKTPEDATYAAQQLNIAATKWNELDIGVKFEWVEQTQDAVFALCHGGSNGGTLASAFFPNPNDLNVLMVYNAAFSMPKWKDNMWKVFTHELGHVLGLRHEFAVDVNLETGKVVEASLKAVQLGPRNKTSVMSYSNKPPEIQQSDAESTRAFYALREDEQGNPPLVGLTEVQDYVPSGVKG